jgi:hypothetical protein
LLDEDSLSWYRATAALQWAKGRARRRRLGWRERVHVTLSQAFAPIVPE